MEQIPVLALQRVLERYAGGFRVETRLIDLLAASPLSLRSSDFKDSDFTGSEDQLAP